MLLFKKFLFFSGRSVIMTLRLCRVKPAIFLFLSLFFVCPAQVFPGPERDSANSAEPLTVIDESSDQQVAVVGRNVVVNGKAREVFVFGGDIIVNGTVDGDVGVIGGNVIQNAGSFVGGDVIVIGGAYRPAERNPGRTAGKETIVFGIFEDELREIGKNPASILSPTLSLAFLAQRLISVIFWFLITMIFSTIAPGAVGRAIANIRLSTMKVVLYGFGGLLTVIFLVVAGVAVLPDYLSALVWLMAFIVLMLAYLFGRVALQITVGKRILKLINWNIHSESAAAILGVLFWTLLLSLPYLWTVALLLIFAAGVGLAVTGRRQGVIAS